MTTYKVQFVQELKSIDHPMLFRFAKWASVRLTEDADFGKKTIFSDEAYFDLGGHVNKQNCRIWGTKNPHSYEYIEKPTHTKSGHFSSKMSKERRLQSMTIVIGPC